MFLVVPVATDSVLTLFICSINYCDDLIEKSTPEQLTLQSSATFWASLWEMKGSSVDSRMPISATF